MSELLYPLPCSCCGGHYEHTQGCISTTDTGLAEKAMYRQIDIKHQHICRELQAEITALKKECETYRREPFSSAQRAIKHFQEENAALKEKLAVAVEALEQWSSIQWSFKDKAECLASDLYANRGVIDEANYITDEALQKLKPTEESK